MTVTQPAPEPPPLGRPAPPVRNGLGVAAIVLGATAFLFVFIPVIGVLGALLAFIGLVLGGVALFSRAHGRPTAIIGTVLSAVALVVALVMGAVYLSAFAGAVNRAGSSDDAPSAPEDVATPETTDEDPPADTTEPGSPVGTMDDPVPYGETVLIDTPNGIEWEVTAREPDLDIDAEVADANLFNDEPQDGMVYARLPVEVTYVGDSSATPSSELEFEFVSAAGRSYDGGILAVDGQRSDVDELFSGASAEGDVIIEIPEQAAALGVWSVGYIFSDDRAFFGG